MSTRRISTQKDVLYASKCPVEYTKHDILLLKVGWSWNWVDKSLLEEYMNMIKWWYRLFSRELSISDEVYVWRDHRCELCWVDSRDISNRLRETKLSLDIHLYLLQMNSLPKRHKQCEFLLQWIVCSPIGLWCDLQLTLDFDSKAMGCFGEVCCEIPSQLFVATFQGHFLSAEDSASLELTQIKI